ncbi:MAG: TonB-dependent receptor plug domain-containing protein, partial [Gammaproteobacteria bacterium]|nr:TonB-dependent receptor plug domain-containing protein [Gammaproteobacteria bacterium]
MSKLIQEFASRSRLLLLIPLLFATGFSSQSLAQDNVGDDSTVVYPASYFVEYSPVTAQDMLDRIPGVNVSSGPGGPGGPRGRNASRGGRGLGSGGFGTQILINGKRTAGKNNNSQNQMERISSDQVDYIELIRGTGGDLDVRGGSQIVNVVLFEQLSSTSLSYELNMDRYHDGEIEPGGSLSYGGQTGKLNFLLSAVAQPRYSNRLSKETSILGDLSLNDEI